LEIYIDFTMKSPFFFHSFHFISSLFISLKWATRNQTINLLTDGVRENYYGGMSGYFSHMTIGLAPIPTFYHYFPSFYLIFIHFILFLQIKFLDLFSLSNDMQFVTIPSKKSIPSQNGQRLTISTSQNSLRFLSLNSF
jgi:hypothetical protein